MSSLVATTANNRSRVWLSDSYAGIAFLQSYSYKVCAPDPFSSITAFDAGANEFNGIGFNDTAFRNEAPPGGIYQTYKLALYIIASEA